MFEWSNLVFIAPAIKTPYSTKAPQSPTSEMLSVSQLQADSAIAPDPKENSSLYEVVSLVHMRDVLGYEFNVHSDAAEKLLLSHMHHRLCDRVDLFVSDTQDTYRPFPLPLGLDESPEVETLFASVEACLSDLDLSVNEAGFFASLSRTFGVLSRLIRSIVAWVLSEVSSTSLAPYNQQKTFLFLGR